MLRIELQQSTLRRLRPTWGKVAMNCGKILMVLKYLRSQITRVVIPVKACPRPDRGRESILRSSHMDPRFHGDDNLKGFYFLFSRSL